MRTWIWGEGEWTGWGDVVAAGGGEVLSSGAGNGGNEARRKRTRRCNAFLGVFGRAKGRAAFCVGGGRVLLCKQFEGYFVLFFLLIFTP